MRPPAPHRPWRRVLATALLALSLTLGSTGAALADPTPAPTPAPAPSTSSAATTPSPDPSPSDSASASSSSSIPVPEPSATSASPGPSSGTTETLTAKAATARSAAERRALLRSRVPASIRRIMDGAEVGHRGAAAQRHALRAAVDPALFAAVVSSCTPGGDAGSVELFVVPDEDVSTLRYVLDGPVRRTGTIPVDDDEAATTLSGLGRGTYRVRLYVDDELDPAADTSVQVLACVTATTACQSATFTNPAGNPTAVVDVADADDEDADFDEFTLAPGASHEQRIPLARVEYFAVDSEDLDVDPSGPVFVISGLGDGELSVPQQGCGSPFRTTIYTPCVSGSVPADVRIEVRHRQDDVRYELRRAPDDGVTVLDGALVGSGTLGAAGTETIDTTVPGRGDYVWLAFLGSDPQPYEALDFAVLACVTTKVSCQSVTFSNPKGNPTVSILYYSYDGAPRDKTIKVKGGKSRTVRVRFAEIDWFAFPASQFGLAEAGELDVVSNAGSVSRLAVPVDCTPASASSGDDDSDDRAELADTGPAPGLGALALLGVALLGAGVATTRRRTSRR